MYLVINIRYLSTGRQLLKTNIAHNSMRRSERISQLPETFYDPETFEIPEAPGIPQNLTTEKYANLVKYFTDATSNSDGYYPKEPLEIQLRDTLCLNCKVYCKASTINHEGVCKVQANCEVYNPPKIPKCISALTSDEKKALRILKIYVKRHFFEFLQI